MRRPLAGGEVRSHGTVVKLYDPERVGVLISPGTETGLRRGVPGRVDDHLLRGR